MEMQPVVTDGVVWTVRLSVCLSVRLSVTPVSPAKMTAPIKMPFGLRTGVGSKNHVLDGVQIPHGKGQS